MHSIKNYKLILASASPRRQQLMKDAGFTFEVRLKNVEEKYPQELHWENVPEYLSKVKASAFREELKADEVLITADTVVCIHDRILGKPADRKEAISMLQELSGNRHLVVTGVSVTTRTEQLSLHGQTCFSSVYQMKRLNSTWTRISHSIKRELTGFRSGSGTSGSSV